MKIDPEKIFNGGRLFLWDEKDLQKAEYTVNPIEVTSLRVGAKCFSYYGIENLLGRLSKYINVAAIELADDRIQDHDMPKVRQQFERAFPAATFKWAYDLLVAGKHGR